MSFLLSNANVKKTSPALCRTYDNSMSAELQNNVLSTFNVFPQLSADGRLSGAGARLDSVFTRYLVTLRLTSHG